MIEEAAQSVQILVFRVGDVRFGADATQIARISRSGHRSRLSDTLGMPREGARALVFRDGAAEEGESEVCIDQVDGVLPAPLSQLRRIPPAAGRLNGILGLWLDDEPQPVILVDLPRTLDLPGGSV